MSTQEQAAREVIQLKQAYNKDGDPAINTANGNKANQLRKQYGLDDSMFGSGVSLANTLSNYHKQFGEGQQGAKPTANSDGTFSSYAHDLDGKRVATTIKGGITYTADGEKLGTGYTSQTGGGIYKVGDDGKGYQVDKHNSTEFNAERSFDKYQQMLEQSTQSGLDAQTAEFEKIYAQKLTDLETALNSAVTEGEISVRDAEAQFEAQKKKLEQDAYQQSEGTKAYGNEMGIGHSQQMIGLQQGDNARTNTLNNSNASDRDGRINDIRDRITTILQNKDLQTTQANTDRGYDIAGAIAKANQTYTAGMSDFMSKDHFAQGDRQHDSNMIDKNQQNTLTNNEILQGYTKDNMFTQDKYNKENAAAQDKYNKENLAIEHKNRFAELGESSRLRIGEMKVGHGFDMDKMAQSLTNDIKLAGINYANQSKLSAQQSAARASEISSSAMSAIKKEQAQYDLAVSRESSKYNPNTPEGKILLNQKNDKITDIMTMSKLEAEGKAVYSNPALNSNPVKPKEKNDFLQFLTGNKKMDAYDAEMKAKNDAIARKNAYEKSAGIK